MSVPILFAALANETRLRCLLLLHATDDLCVCEMTEAIGTAQPNMSRHLANLRDTGIVVDRRSGKWIHYRLNPKLPAWAVETLRQAEIGTQDIEPFKLDRTRLAQLLRRADVARCA